METMQKGNCGVETISHIFSGYAKTNFKWVGLGMTSNAEWRGLVHRAFP